MRPGGLTIVSGGVPTAHQLVALAASVTALVDEERAAAAIDPLPAAYRSRWRRAAAIEASEVPSHVKDDASPWGVL